MTALELLTAVRGLLADEARWCKGAAARNADGAPVIARHEGAVAWDLLGALRRCDRPTPGGPSPAYRPAWLALDAVMRAHGRHTYLQAFNDNSSHPEVLALVDDAARALRLADAAGAGGAG